MILINICWAISFLLLLFQKLLEDLEKKYGQKFKPTTGFEGIVQGIDITDHGIYVNGDYRRKADQHPGGY